MSAAQGRQYREEGRKKNWKNKPEISKKIAGKIEIKMDMEKKTPPVITWVIVIVIAYCIYSDHHYLCNRHPDAPQCQEELYPW